MNQNKKILRKHIKEVVAYNVCKKRLCIFDFDDTLVETDAKIYVTTSNNKKFVLTPGEYSVYEQMPDDKFDYSEFEKLVNPRVIKWTYKIIKQAHEKHGPNNVVILTARGVDKPIYEFLKSINLHDIGVVALGSPDPVDKANWIALRLQRNDVHHIEFFDDSHANIEAVRQLAQTMPHITFDLNHVVNYVDDDGIKKRA